MIHSNSNTFFSRLTTVDRHSVFFKEKYWAPFFSEKKCPVRPRAPRFSPVDRHSEQTQIAHCDAQLYLHSAKSFNRQGPGVECDMAARAVWCLRAPTAMDEAHKEACCVELRRLSQAVSRLLANQLCFNTRLRP